MVGTIENLKKVECEKCGATTKLVYHHTNYYPEEIQILCLSCHRKEHYLNPVTRPQHFSSKVIKFDNNTVKVSDFNKKRLDVLLARKIGKEQNPAVIMDDVVSELLDLWETSQTETKRGKDVTLI